MSIKEYGKKYHYLLAFLLGMTLMVIIYVFFDVVTDSEYRTRTSASGDTDSINTQSGQIADSIVLTTNETEEETVKVYMGIEIIDLNSIMVSQLDLSNENGVLINNVFTNSPAQEAELKRRDVIVSLNNRPTKDTSDFKDIVSDLAPDDRVRIVYFRNGSKAQTYVVLAQGSVTSPAPVTTDSSTDDWGVTLSEVTPSLRNIYGIPNSVDGIVVLSVEPGSLADVAGLSAGSVISQIDKTPITDMDDFFAAIENDNNSVALLDVYANGNFNYIPLDSSTLQEETITPAPISVYDRIFAVFTGGAPFGDDEEEDEEGPKGGKFADDDVTLTASDTSAFNRPSDPPGEDNATGTSSTGDIALNRPSQVPSQTSGSNNDIVFFIALLLLIILYLAHREYYRPKEIE